ncbi:glycosyltransferase [Cryobacterium sp. PH31-L1]|nr:glycosyltransferase [Cryobacterium sp. PH31-L1]MDJ0376966.1 glycosyltransferase [Cryobacterium sp. PH31-L1]
MDGLLDLGLTAKKYILSVGSRDPRKNASALIRAHGSLPSSTQLEFPLILVGAGASSAFDTSATLIETGVRHLGYVSDEILAMLYAQARLVVFPSIDEGFGLPAIEALACGADLLVSEIPVLRWVCGQHAEYFSLADTSALVRALSLLIHAPSAGTGTPEERSSYATERFSWSTTVKVIENAIADQTLL